MSEKRILAYYSDGDGILLIEKMSNVLISWEVRLDMRIRQLKTQGVDYALVSELPSEKYRDAWKLNNDLSAVIIDEKKALEIARRRATAALISCKNRMIAKGRAESLKTGKSYTGLSEKDETEFRGSLEIIKKSLSLRYLESVERNFKGK